MNKFISIIFVFLSVVNVFAEYPNTSVGIIDLNINPHYIDQIEGIEHMGESRETRINEFHNLNDQLVVGLREGSSLSVMGNDIILTGTKKAVIFKKGNKLFEIETGFNLKNLI